MEGDLHSPPNVRAFLEYVSTGALKGTPHTQLAQR